MARTATMNGPLPYPINFADPFFPGVETSGAIMTGPCQDCERCAMPDPFDPALAFLLGVTVCGLILSCLGSHVIAARRHAGGAALVEADPVAAMGTIDRLMVGWWIAALWALAGPAPAGLIGAGAVAIAGPVSATRLFEATAHRRGLERFGRVSLAANAALTIAAMAAYGFATTT